MTRNMLEGIADGRFEVALRAWYKQHLGIDVQQWGAAHTPRALVGAGRLLKAMGSQTLVGWRQLFDSAEQREKVAAVVHQANEQNLVRLQAEVARVRP